MLPPGTSFKTECFCLERKRKPPPRYARSTAALPGYRTAGPPAPSGGPRRRARALRVARGRPRPSRAPPGRSHRVWRPLPREASAPPSPFRVCTSSAGPRGARGQHAPRGHRPPQAQAAPRRPARPPPKSPNPGQQPPRLTRAPGADRRPGPPLAAQRVTHILAAASAASAAETGGEPVGLCS